MSNPASEARAAPGVLPSPAAVTAEPDSGEAARNAGRGGLAVAFAKLYFIALGLVQQIALPAVLGLEGYGALSRVLSTSSIAYNPVTSASIQAVSRQVVQAAPGAQAATIRRVLRIHAFIAVLLGAVFFLVSPAIARATGAEHVGGTLRLMSAILMLYGVYTPLIGVVNGQKRFFVQAGFDVTAATLRTIGLVLGALFWVRSGASGVTGAVSGFVLSAAVITALALGVVGAGAAGGDSPRLGQHLKLIGHLLLGHVLLNALFQADLTLLGRFATHAARAAGEPVARADALVGAYRATQLFSFLPYQILIAITFILFPMLAGAAKKNDQAAITSYVKLGTRLALVLAGAMVSVTVGLAPRLLELVYGEQTRALGGRSLALLAIGFGAFAMFGILTTVLNSLGLERQSALITGLAVLLVASLCWLRVRGGPLSEELLWLTAQATTAGLFLATGAAAVLVRRAAGAVLPISTLLRVLFAFGGAVAFARLAVPPGKLLTLVGGAVTPVVYLALLVGTRELGKRDLQLLGALRGKRG